MSAAESFRKSLQGLYVRWLLLFALWLALYWHLEVLAEGFVYEFLGLAREDALAWALIFFCYDTPKIFLLLVLMIYAVGLLRANLKPEGVRELLQGRGRFYAYLMGALFGAVTPFCSCSSIPLFLGFTMARIPLGATMAFLITSPLVNELAVVLLWGLLGWKMTLFYVITGLASGVIAGAVVDLLHGERWLMPFLREAVRKNEPGLQGLQSTGLLGLEARHRFAMEELAVILRRVWPWVLVGVGIGAALHGYVPSDWISTHLSGRGWWEVVCAVLLGIPLYTNVTGSIPVMESLLTKGLPVGTTLAFCMSAVAVSLPELCLLKQVMTWRLIALFLTILLFLFTVLGFLLNALSV